MNKFTKNFKYLRAEKGISMTQLAKELGVSISVICYWENGKRFPDMFSLIKLSDYFKVSIDGLVKYDVVDEIGESYQDD